MDNNIINRSNTLTLADLIVANAQFDAVEAVKIDGVQKVHAVQTADKQYNIVANAQITAKQVKSVGCAALINNHATYVKNLPAFAEKLIATRDSIIKWYNGMNNVKTRKAAQSDLSARAEATDIVDTFRDILFTLGFDASDTKAMVYNANADKTERLNAAAAANQLVLLFLPCFTEVVSVGKRADVTFYGVWGDKGLTLPAKCYSAFENTLYKLYADNVKSYSTVTAKDAKAVAKNINHAVKIEREKAEAERTKRAIDAAKAEAEALEQKAKEAKEKAAQLEKAEQAKAKAEKPSKTSDKSKTENK